MVNQPDDTAGAREKLADAREAQDQAGTDMVLVDRGDAALARGDIHEGRALLEQAIGAWPHTARSDPAPIRQTTPEPAPPASGPADQPSAATSEAPMEMATGAEAGTAVVSEPLDVRPRLDGGDWGLLAGSLTAGLVGVYLGLRFRPRHAG